MKKFFKYLFWTIAVLIVVAAAGIFIFIKTFDLNKYKTYAEDIVYRQTGRKLTLNGNAGLKISLIPTVVLNDVALANAAWAAEPEMIKAKSIEVTFSILPLLKKEIVIDKVDLISPEVYLSVSKSGVPNWEFSKPAAGDTRAAAAKQDTAGAAPLPAETLSRETVEKIHAASSSENVPAAAQTALIAGVVAKNLKIENGVVVYRDLKSGSRTEIKINSLSVVAEGADENIRLDFDTVYNGEKIAGSAAAGSINAILRALPDYPLKADIKAFGASMQADVKLNGLNGDLKYAGSIQADNPAGNFGAPAIKLQSSINGGLDNVALNIKSLDVAGNVATGSLKASLKGSKPYLSGNLQSAYVNLQTLSAKPQKTAFAVSRLVPAAAAAQFVPAIPLDLSVLNAVNADLKIAVTKLAVNEMLSAENIVATVNLKNGALSVQPLSARLGGGSLDGSASLNANGNSFSTSLTGKDIIIQDLWKGLAVSGSNFGILQGGKTNFTVKLSGRGATLRQMAEELSGQIAVVVGESRIQTGSLKYLSGNFVSQLLSSLNVKQRSKNMDLNCAVVRTDIAGGKAQFPKGIVFNSKQLVIVSDGSLNLQNDKLDFSIHPFNGKLADTNVAQAISSLVKIGGTVEHPKITLDNSAVIKNIVGVAAAGPAFLGSQAVLGADESPCYTALQGTPYKNMFPAPKGAKAAGQGVYKGTGKVIDNSVDAIANTAKDVLGLFKRKKNNGRKLGKYP